MRAGKTRKILAIALALGATSFGLVAASTPAAAPAAPSCPTGYMCQAMPSPSTGVVQIGPVTALDPPGAGTESVFIKLYDFPPGDPDVEVYLCANPGGGTTLTTPPVCATGQGNVDNNGFDAAVNLPIYPVSTPPSASAPPGTSAYSEPIPEVQANSGSAGIPGYIPPSGESDQSFFCDANDPCSIDITDSSINDSRTPSSANSVVTPLQYAPSSDGCPQSTFINTESEFGIDLLMPVLSRLACVAGASPAVALNTATDGVHALTDLANPQSGIQIAFTDDPEAPDQQAIITKNHFALIPIGLTANAIAFLSQLHSPTDGRSFPQSGLDLTPTMVAGLITDDPLWPGASGTDNSAPCVGASQYEKGCMSLAPCYGTGEKTDTCSLYLQLNFVDGYLQFGQNTAVDRSDPSGSTDQLFSWLCTAPTVPINLGGTTKPTETETAAQVIVASLNAQDTQPTLKSCPITDTFPYFKGISNVITAAQPNQQALKVFNGVYGANANTNAANAGFAPMNWATSYYYGMSVASLQNAAGSFVSPSAASLDAAVNDATTNPDGSLTFHNLASDPAAYPMASMFYAAVPTTPVPGGTATSEKLMLNQLLALTGGADTSDLPTGFVPLPAALYTEARADIVKDIVAAPATSTGGGGSSSSSSGGSTSGSGSSNSGGSSSAGSGSTTALPTYNFNSGSAVVLPIVAARGTLAVQAATSAKPVHPSGPLLGPALPGFTLLASRQQLLFPGSQMVALVTTAVGALLLMAVLLRRRVRGKASLAAASEE
jgi:uncharacterized membrane protein YgcG